MKRLHRKEGFTLIELMIVILIIAILVAIAVPVYLAARNNAQRRTCQANLRTIDGAINQYYAEAEIYPTGMDSLTQAPYQVLREAPRCPTSNTTTYGGIAGGARSTCPTSVAGHTY